jgi:hypothetical protein
MNDRELQLATGMIDSGERRIGNLKLRPYTMGSMQLAYLLKLTMFTRGKDDPPLELDDLEEQRQIMAFAWMQSADEDDIADAVRDDTVDRCVLKFSLNVTFDMLPGLMAEINRINAMLAASSVRVESKYPSTPAGWQARCSPSPRTPVGARTSSSGGCRWRVPFSITTARCKRPISGRLSRPPKRRCRHSRQTN